ncbi:DUF3150 domain-containing protein [Methylobacter sp. YRD-M1]|uniref:DUF3150 domain-containing protein n=1 Tax=Methylobacter sp. YRD-M1 TaxID=2911520 RepID=UPI00227A7FFF|nr:DUF3150 domain-containing protein [Methylobacter sp. YRD-M1]WAK04386.1 DUF3150 domain-containing protein [Methylobacter sp. YRD-M1]
MSHNAEMILDQIDVVKLDINLWTSSKKLRPEDLVLGDGSILPPEDLAHLGTKKTVDPEKLKEFNRIKKEAERICLESGTRFLGGFANPRSEIPRIIQELDKLSKTFEEAKREFISTYDNDTRDWIARHPEFGDAIRRAIEPVASVANKLRFDYVIFRVTRPDSDVQADESLDRRTNSMSDQLFHEIAQEANQLVERSFVGKDTVTARALNAFRRMRDKLDSLGFLDHRCMPVVDEIDAVLKALSPNGPYNGVAFHSLFRLGLLLSDPDKIKRHGSGLLQAPDTFFEEEDADDDVVVVNEQVISDDQVILAADSEVAVPAPVSAPEVIQPSSPEIIAVAEESTLGEQPEAPSESADIDDIPGFDDFLATFKPGQEVSDAAPAVVADVQVSAIQEEALETPAAAVFIESVKETVNAAAQSVSSIPADSVQDDLGVNADEMEPEETAASAEVADFWF